MNTELVTTLISVGGVVLSAIISLVASMALVNWRIANLEKKVDEHNEYAKKFADCAQDIALLQKDIVYIKERLK